ncbi:E3 ubiquitin-protein ligase SH3RF1 isoform X2 [Engraulis encrasicolus]|uniref:E3 ubiquitin-protein ligase SH3RF1 isoform X2 n=1 Tax=Engraulis encrasicolus TaxID=184585 RepID=UPI002FD540F7
MRSGGGGGGVMDVGQKEENEKTRHYAELAKPGGGGGGGLHATNVTVYRTGGSDHPQPLQPQPLCTALYDFNTRDLDPQDCKDCLTFCKGDVITVLKRVDDKWIEGMLGDKVGIFPLQFAELNPVARQLLDSRRKEGIESTTTTQTESSSLSSRPTFARRSSGREHKRGSVNVNSTNASTNVNAHLAALRRHASFSAAHRTTSSSRPTTTSTTHVNLLNSLNKPPAAVPVPGLAYAPQPLVLVSAQAPKAAPAAAPLVPVSVSSRPVRALQGSFKHHRSSSLRRSLHQTDRKMNGGESQSSTITMALIDPQEHVDKTHNTQQLSISVCAALYSYKPQHSEELELRKGEMVGVYGKFKEGWLRGLSLRTGKVGILPSNYVTPVLRTSARFVESKTINPSSLTNSSSSSSNGAVGTGTGRRHGHGHSTHTHTQKPSVGNSTTTIMEHQQQHQQHHQQQVTLTDPNGVTTTMGMGHGLPQPITQVSMAGQHTVTSHSGMRSGGGHSGAKHGWDIVRRAFHSTHRGLVQRASHRSHSHSHSHLTPSLQPRSSGPDLGQIYTYGRSPVLPRKRNGLFSNHHGGARQQCWTTETLPPPSGGYQAFHRDLLPPSLPLSSGNNNNHTSSSSGPLHSILVKPESKHNMDKPAKSVRFLTEDPAPPPQLSSWTSSLPSFGRQPQYSSGPQSNTTTTTTTTTPIMELWNPSAILGRDGNSSVLRDFKSSSNNNTIPLRKDTGFGHAYGDGSPFTLKSSGSQSSPSRRGGTVRSQTKYPDDRLYMVSPCL